MADFKVGVSLLISYLQLTESILAKYATPPLRNMCFSAPEHRLAATALRRTRRVYPERVISLGPAALPDPAVMSQISIRVNPFKAIPRMYASKIITTKISHQLVHTDIFNLYASTSHLTVHDCICFVLNLQCQYVHFNQFFYRK